MFEWRPWFTAFLLVPDGLAARSCKRRGRPLGSIPDRRNGRRPDHQGDPLKRKRGSPSTYDEVLSPGGRSTIVSCSSRQRRGKEAAGPDGRGGHHRVLSARTTHGSAGAASVGPMSQSSRASPPASSRRPCPGHNINFAVRRTLTPGRQLAPRKIKPVPKLHLMLLLTDALSPSLCSTASHSLSFFLSDAQSSVSPLRPYFLPR